MRREGKYSIDNKGIDFLLIDSKVKIELDELHRRILQLHRMLNEMQKISLDTLNQYCNMQILHHTNTLDALLDISLCALSKSAFYVYCMRYSMLMFHAKSRSIFIKANNAPSFSLKIAMKNE